MTGGPDLFPVELTILVSIKSGKKRIQFFGILGKGQAVKSFKYKERKLLELVQLQNVVLVLVSNLKHLSNHCLKVIAGHSGLALPSETLHLNLSLKGLDTGPDFVPGELSVVVGIEVSEHAFHCLVRLIEIQSLAGLKQVQGELLELVEDKDLVSVVI